MNSIQTSLIMLTVAGNSRNIRAGKYGDSTAERVRPADNKFDEDCDWDEDDEDDEDDDEYVEESFGINWKTSVIGCVAILFGAYWWGTLAAGYWYAVGPILGFVICITLSCFSWKEHKLENLNAATENRAWSGMDWVAMLGTAALVVYTLWDAGMFK